MSFEEYEKKNRAYKDLHLQDMNAEELTEKYRFVLDSQFMLQEQNQGGVNAIDLLKKLPIGENAKKIINLSPPLTLSEEEERIIRGNIDKKTFRKNQEAYKKHYNKIQENNKKYLKKQEKALEELEKTLRTQEKKRLRRETGRMINGDAELRRCLTRLGKTKDDNVKKEMTDQFLELVVTKLLQNEDLSKGAKKLYFRKHEYRDKVRQYRMINEEQIADENMRAMWADPMDAWMDSVEKLEFEILRRDIMEDIVLPALEKDKEFGFLNKKIKTGIKDKAKTAANKESQIKMELSAFENSVYDIMNTGLSEEELKKLKKDGKLFKIYSSKKRMRDYDKQYKKALREGKTPKEAEKAAAENLKKEFIKKCEERTGAEAIVSGADAETVKKYGCASSSMTVPYSEGLKVEKESNGFICAIPCKADPRMVELRPTVPETLKIGNKTIPFRRQYNILMKTMARLAYDKKGNLRGYEGDKHKLRQYLNNIDYFMKSGMADEETKKLLVPEMKKILEEQYAKDQKKLERGAIDAEIETILSNLSTAFMELAIGEVSVESLGIADLEMQQADLQKLTEKATKIQLAGQNITAKEVKKAFDDLQKDLAAAKIQYLKIRDLDIDGKQAPIPNACSSNGDFVRRMQEKCQHKKSPCMTFYLEEYVLKKENRQSVVNQVIDHIDTMYVLTDQNLTKEDADKIKTELLPIQAKLNADPNAELSEKELSLYKNRCMKFTKYVYHIAAYVGEINGKHYTTEGFAAESTQYLVEPFTMTGSVGAYKGRNYINAGNADMTAQRRQLNDGMINYYLKDKPFPSKREDAVKFIIKNMIKGDN